MELQTINQNELFKAVLLLPKDVTTNEITIEINNKKILLKNVNSEWQLQNKLNVEGLNRIVSVYCVKCKCKTVHKINKEASKLRCEKCETINEFK